MGFAGDEATKHSFHHACDDVVDRNHDGLRRETESTNTLLFFTTRQPV